MNVEETNAGPYELLNAKMRLTVRLTVLRGNGTEKSDRGYAAEKSYEPAVIVAAESWLAMAARDKFRITAPSTTATPLRTT